MKVTITNIARKSTDKEGNQLKNKAGKPYTRLSIKTQEHGDKWLSGFSRQDNASWKEGDTVDITVEQKGEYLNFTMPERPQALGFTIEDRDRLLRIEIAVQSILQGIKTLALNGDKVAPAVKNGPAEDGGWEDIDEEASGIAF